MGWWMWPLRGIFWRALPSLAWGRGRGRGRGKGGQRSQDKRTAGTDPYDGVNGVVEGVKEGVGARLVRLVRLVRW